jgi:pSer/pThr/pTyr-binding forkhead associated (FHA) protein
MQVTLKVMVGKSAGREIPIPVPRFLIGRSADCHMRPKSDAISRRHCAISTKGNRVFVRDLKSRNGTFVNGERIEGKCELNSGDTICVGKLEFEVCFQPDDAAVAPEKPSKATAVEDEAVQEATAAAADEAAEAADETPTAEASKADAGSIDFDVGEWLSEADAQERTRRQSEPDTRQFQLDESDRAELEGAGEAAGDEEGEEEEESARGPQRPEKKAPGKLPQQPTKTTATSRDAAAEMLKKYFDNR